MKNMKRLVLTPFLFVLISCVHVPRNYIPNLTYSIDSDGTTTYMMSTYMLPPDDNNRSSIVSIRLDVLRVDLRGYKPIFGLRVVYTGLEWLHIEDGQSLILFMDGHRLGLKGERVYGRSMWNILFLGNVFTETGIYTVTPDELTQIAEATQVNMKIIGMVGTREATFRPVEKLGFDNFVKKYVTPINNVSLSKPSHIDK
jgi:hypothetical protein